MGTNKINEDEIPEIDPENPDCDVKGLIRDYSVRHNVKDSVFKYLFGDKEYLLRFYKDLHPEDTEAVRGDLESITIDRPIINQMCNDLGFVVKNKLIVLVEAQSTWSVNICFRMFLYLAQTYINYIRDHAIDLYHFRAKLPKPELYVIYTGIRRKKVPRKLSLNKEFWGGTAPLDLIVTVISKAELSTVAGQYIIFSRIYDRQREILSYIENEKERKKAAMRNTLNICLKKGVLTGFVTKYKEDLSDMVSVLHDTDYLLDMLEKRSKAEGKAEGIKEGKAEGIKEGKAKGKAEGKAEQKREILNRLRSLGYTDKDIRAILG